LKKLSGAGSDFELDDGVNLDVKVGFDENGMPVIRELKFHYPKGRVIPQGGITAQTFRLVKFQEILVDHFEKESSLTLSQSERTRLLKYVTNDMEFSGRAGFPKEFYAALSYFYVESFEKHPNEATVRLSQLLDLPKRTVVNRLGMARKLGLLTHNSPTKSSGKAGGVLTKEGSKLIVDYLNRSD